MKTTAKNSYNVRVIDGNISDFFNENSLVMSVFGKSFAKKSNKKIVNIMNFIERQNLSSYELTILKMMMDAA